MVRRCRRRWTPRHAASSSTSATAAQLCVSGRRAGHSAGTNTRHHWQRRPRGQHQHARYAVPTLGNEQVPEPRLSLEQVIAMTTVKPAKVIGRIDGLGTLTLGAPADVSVLELVEEPVTFVDTMNNERRGTRWLRPVDTARGPALRSAVSIAILVSRLSCTFHGSPSPRSASST